MDTLYGVDRTNARNKFNVYLLKASTFISLTTIFKKPNQAAYLIVGR